MTAVVNGTVHRADTQSVIGLFEQTFMLCRDPLVGHALRIKRTGLTFRVAPSAMNPVPGALALMS